MQIRIYATQYMQNAHQARISWSFFPLVWRTADVAADGDGRSAYVDKDTGQLATEVLRGEGAGEQGQEESRGNVHHFSAASQSMVKFIVLS